MQALYDTVIIILLARVAETAHVVHTVLWSQAALGQISFKGVRESTHVILHLFLSQDDYGVHVRITGNIRY